MYNVSFLNELLEQERIFLHTQELREIADLSRQIVAGIEAYENATVITSYEHVYGYTKHFELLIGEEGIFQQAKEGISKFFLWLKEKIVTFISKLFRVFRDIKASIKTHFSPGQDQPMVWKYDINKVTKAWGNTVNKLVELSVELNDNTDFSKFENFNQKLEDTFKAGLVEESRNQVYRRREIYKHATAISSDLNQISSSIGTYIKALEEFKTQIKDTIDVDTLADKIYKSLGNVNNLFVHVDVDTDAQPTNIIKGFVRLLSISISAVDTVGEFGLKYLTDLHKAYTKDDYSINMTFPMDQNFVKRLGEHYGMSFRIRNMVVTNTNPLLWPNPVDDKPSALMGWCMIGTGSNTVDFYVNVKVILSWYDRVFNAATVGVVSKIDQFLFVVVHECRHLYDSQMGTEIDMSKDYDEQDHERVANDAARTFKITDADRSWAKKIIQAVEAEYKKQMNK